MARPRSEDKRNAILLAATQVFAERGLSAATAAISSAAGIAEGTLFTYFKTKEELLNTLYHEIKLELADAMMTGYPRRAGIHSRLQHVWDHYLNWGVQNPSQQKVLQQITIWGGLTEESKSAGMAPFKEIESMARTAVEQHVFVDRPLEFIAATMSALGDMTLDFMRRYPQQAELYRATGFDLAWAGITRK